MTRRIFEDPQSIRRVCHAALPIHTNVNIVPLPLPDHVQPPPLAVGWRTVFFLFCCFFGGLGASVLPIRSGMGLSYLTRKTIKIYGF